MKKVDTTFFKIMPNRLEYIDLAKPKSGAPYLFILSACRVSEKNIFRIVRVLMFSVAALIIKSFSLPFSTETFIA